MYFLRNLCGKRKRENKNKAFIFGTNYKDTESELSGCVNDCKRITLAFELLKYSVTKFFSEKAPTKNEVVSKIDAWFKSLNNNDNAIFYYSGHGTQVDDLTGSEEDGKDEAIFVNPSFSLTDDALRRLVDQTLLRAPQLKLFFIFDCCESGSIVDLPFRYSSIKKELKTDNKKLMPGNAIAISGCDDGKFSYEQDGIGRLTQAILEAIASEKPLTWFEFYSTVIKKMPPMEEEEFQQVQLSFSNEEALNNFWLFSPLN